MDFLIKLFKVIKTPVIASFLVFGLLIYSSVFLLSHTDIFEPDVLDHIMEQGEITFLTRNNPHCYYIYRSQPMGFEYELAQAFADYLGVNLDLRIAEDWDQMIPSLQNETSHVVGASLTVTPKRKKNVAFSKGYMKIRQRIITSINNRRVKDAEDLAEKVIHVRKGTSYQERLESLQKTGLDFKLVTIDNIPTIDLIQKVAKGEIDITIADTNIAMLARHYYPGVVVGGAISDEEHLAWAVNLKAGRLRHKINTFFDVIKKNGTLDKIYNKYYSDIDLFNYLDIKAFHRRIAARFPEYEQIIKGASEKYGFDWRLIAAQIYQESHFRQWAKSSAGAYGLMQLTWKTAKSLGVTNIYNPEQNIYAGVRHLRMLYNLFRKAEGADRLFIALGAYNIGQGHMRDAQRLARKLEIDPAQWSSMQKTLALLDKYKYYKDARYGYCRGTQTINYVRQIMVYYDILKHQGIDFNLSLRPSSKKV